MPFCSVWMDFAKTVPKQACPRFSLTGDHSCFSTLLSVFGTPTNIAVVEILAILVTAV